MDECVPVYLRNFPEIPPGANSALRVDSAGPAPHLPLLADSHLTR